ncbi:tRNA 2-selenouridine(34) synthase MnmH [Pseudoneobacillus sp. C159]
MLKEITVEQYLSLDNVIAVDVRSPIEFKDGAIPGAINIPLFSDEERADIGTIYKQQGQSMAKWRAMEIVSPKIPVLMEQIKRLIDAEFTPVIHCWRGGMRSKAISTFLEYSGLHCLRLIGGYKAYRHHILEKLNENLIGKTAIVIHGKTGVGKTEILHQLKAKGYPVLDLEGIAGHRGSIFGAIGLGEGHNQKTFDALLFDALVNVKDSSYIIMEAESKRIGKAVQPQILLDMKENGIHLYLQAHIETRIQHIMNEYVLPFSDLSWFEDKVKIGLEKIEKRLKNINKQNEINQCFLTKNWVNLIQLLLEDYYDPMYDHKRSEYSGHFEVLYANNIDHATNEIEEIITKKMKSEKVSQ